MIEDSLSPLLRALFRPPDFHADDGTKADPFGLFIVCALFGTLILMTAISRDVLAMCLGVGSIIFCVPLYLTSSSAHKRKHGKIMLALMLAWIVEFLVFFPNSFYLGSEKFHW